MAGMTPPEAEMQHFATSAMNLHGLPPSILPLDSLDGFAMTDDEVELTLPGPMKALVHGCTIHYSPKITATLSFGEVSNIQGMMFTVAEDEDEGTPRGRHSRKLSLPVDSLTVAWGEGEGEGETQVIEVSMGPAQAEVPASAFNEKKVKTRRRERRAKKDEDVTSEELVGWGIPRAFSQAFWGVQSTSGVLKSTSMK